MSDPVLEAIDRLERMSKKVKLLTSMYEAVVVENCRLRSDLAQANRAALEAHVAYDARFVPAINARLKEAFEKALDNDMFAKII